MDDQNTKVILVNRARPYAHTPSPVIGWSNTNHGFAVWDDSQAGMTFTLSLDEWRAIAFDVSRAVQRSRIDLWAFDVEVAENPTETPFWDGEFRDLLLTQLRDTMNAGPLDSICCSLDAIGQAILQRAKELIGAREPSPMPTPGVTGGQIILTNRYLNPSACSNFSGAGGQVYAHAMHEDALRRQICRLTLEQWRLIKEDATRGFLRGPISQWELDYSPATPRFNAEGIATVGAAESLDALQAIGDELSPVLGLLVARARVLIKSSVVEIVAQATEYPNHAPGAERHEVVEIYTEESLATVTNYRSLLKVAKAAGVPNAERIETTVSLRVAILEHQAANPPEVKPEVAQAVAVEPPRPPGPGQYFDIPPEKESKRPAFQGGCTR